MRWCAFSATLPAVGQRWSENETWRFRCRAFIQRGCAACWRCCGTADALSRRAKPMLTRWAATVSPTNVHPEYPRPQFVRPDWQNLNGLWDYAMTADARRAPATFAGKILVPFPVESYLSGVQKRARRASTLWYRRTCEFPPRGAGGGCCCILARWIGRRPCISMAGCWVRIEAGMTRSVLT